MVLGNAKQGKQCEAGACPKNAEFCKKNDVRQKA